MTKKDYVAIAAAIKASRITGDPGKLHAIRFLNLLTEYLAKDNPRFDLRRFEEAALPEA